MMIQCVAIANFIAENFRYTNKTVAFKNLYPRPSMVKQSNRL